MNNDNRNRARRARQHPETNPQHGRQVVSHPPNPSPKTGTSSTRAVTKVDPKRENKLAKARRKKRDAAVAEAKWQEDIVRVRGGVDGVMLAIILILVALGCITVFSASYPEAVRKSMENPNVDGMTYVRSQILYVVIGFAAMALMAWVIPVNFYRSWAPLTAYVVAILLLIIVLFYGTAVGVTKRWIPLGPINIQPSEIMKLAIILMIAWYFDKYERQMNDSRPGFREQFKWNTIYPILILGLACGFVLIGKHLSGTIIVGMIGLLMLIVGGCNLKWLFATGIPLAGVAIGGFLALNPYALKRITTFTDENADKLDELYQTTQSIYAIGSGGLFGVGLGESRQKFSYLSAAHTDFIFAIWCEEWGFIGAVFLIVLFLLFMWRGYVIALRAPDKFTMLTAFGITTHVGIQAFFNMCVVADMFPNTGITLPFFSYGGSSLIVLLFEMGILLSISRQYYRKKSDLYRK